MRFAFQQAESHDGIWSDFQAVPAGTPCLSMIEYPQQHIKSPLEDQNMVITELTHRKKRYLPLLLLADEQEEMIDRYLERGTMYALLDGSLKAVCVVTDEGDGILELKNIAVSPEARRQGYGRALIRFLRDTYRGRFHTLQVGTGESPVTLSFYESCGFYRSHRVENFFLDHYDHPIFECGVQLRDMIYLRMAL